MITYFVVPLMTMVVAATRNTILNACCKSGPTNASVRRCAADYIYCMSSAGALTSGSPEAEYRWSWYAERHLVF